MDHVGRNIERGFGGDEDHPPPVARPHARKISSRQAHTRHDIDSKKVLPLLIWSFEEVLRAEDPDIVDEDVSRGLGLHNRRAALRGAEISCHTAHRCVGVGSLELAYRLVDGLLLAAVQHNGCTRLRQSLGYRKADAAGRSRHDCRFFGKVDFHPSSPVRAEIIIDTTITRAIALLSLNRDNLARARSAQDRAGGAMNSGPTGSLISSLRIRSISALTETS